MGTNNKIQKKGITLVIPNPCGNIKETKMKNSGVEWIGEIPDGWEVKRLKNLFDFVKGLPITKENLKETGVSVISYGQIHSKQNSGTRIDDSLKRFVDESYLTSNSNSLVHKSDFIFADTSEDLEGCGNCVYVDEEQTLFAGYHTIIFSSKIKQSNKYLAYLFKTDAWRNQIRSRCNGVKLFSITKRILSNVNIVLPPILKQESIAKMLDSKCAQIDSIIEESKKSIEEYKAWKQSVIFEAVTGKNLNCKKKDSGIEWIGEIPEEWEIVKLRNIGRCQNGISKSSEFFGKGTPFVSYGDVYKNLTLPKNVTGLIQSSSEEKVNYSVKRGDIFFTRTSETIDEVGISSVCLKTINDACFAGFLIRVRPFNNMIIPEFAKYYFRNLRLRDYFAKEMTLVTRASLNQNLLKELPVVVPPRPEQESIAKMLDSKCAQIDSLITEKESLIADLTEYKKSLIFEVVTGKRSI